MSAPILDSRASWVRMAVSFAVATVGNVGIWAIVAVLPDMQEDFGATRGGISFAYTTTMAGFALGSLIAGRFVDRHGIGPVLLAAAGLNALSFAGAAFAGSLALLAVFQTLMGLGTAVTFAPLLADISHWFLRRRGLAVNLVACGNYLAGALWPLLLSGVLESSGWRIVYLIIAAIIGAVMIPLSLVLRRPLPAAAHAAADRIAAENRAAVVFEPRALMILLAIAGVGCCVAMAMPQVHIVALSVHLGCGVQAGVEMLSLMLLGGVVSRLVSGLLADRIGGLRTLLIGSTLQMVGLILYLPAETQAQLYAVSLIFGLAQGGIVPSYALIVREYMPAAEAATRTGFVITATIVGMALGGWASGWIFDLTGSYTPAFWNGIGWNLLNIAIVAAIILAVRRRRIPA